MRELSIHLSVLGNDAVTDGVIENMLNIRTGQRAQVPGASAEPDAAADQARSASETNLPQRRPLFKPALAPLAGYLTRRALDKRAVDGIGVEKLRDADRALRATRRDLDIGRGNVREDIDRTDGESTRRQAGSRLYTRRAIGPHLFHMHGAPEEQAAATLGSMAAASKFMRAGNCGDFAVVAMTHLAHTMDHSDQASLVSDNRATHQWVQLQTAPPLPDGPIVIDAWCEGSAVLREDCAGIAQPDNTVANATLTESEVKVAHTVCDWALRFRLDDRDPDVDWRRVPNFQLPAAQTFASTHVLSNRMLSEVPVVSSLPLHVRLSQAEGQLPFTVGPLGEPVQSGHEPYPAEEVNELPAAMRFIDNKVELRKQLAAAGAAYALGTSVRGSAQAAADIVNASE